MRYRQHVVLTIDVDDETFAHQWPEEYSWEAMIRRYLSERGTETLARLPTEHLKVHACSVDPEVLDLGCEAIATDHGRDYSPGYWRYQSAEPVHTPYYVNVYELDQGYGGPEEGGWWFSVGIPVEEACEVYETAEAAEIARKALEEKYPRTDKQYSVLGGADYAVQIEDHPPRAWPETRPHYC